MKLNAVHPTAKAERIVVAYPCGADDPPHQMASHASLGRKLAKLLQSPFIDSYDPKQYPGMEGIYYIPSETLVGGDRADPHGSMLVVRSVSDLFGGVAPHPFVATKAITHPLLHPAAQAPTGWSTQFGLAAKDAVLNGTTAFTAEDALNAGKELLRNGALRVKAVNGTGGRGQRTVRNLGALAEAIEQYGDKLPVVGLVLEEHLDDVETYSVGQVQVGDLLISYVGTQELTPDNSGVPVYGGSVLRLVRGRWNALLEHACSAAEFEAVRLACIYDEAAFRCFPTLYASRRNYDVARGLNGAGKPRCGVLEQSWRAGGASFAEACALEFFDAEPEAQTVRAFTAERYGRGQQVPSTAQLVFQDDDPAVGFITKYGGLSAYGHDT